MALMQGYRFNFRCNELDASYITTFSYKTHRPYNNCDGDDDNDDDEDASIDRDDDHHDNDHHFHYHDHCD